MSNRVLLILRNKEIYIFYSCKKKFKKKLGFFGEKKWFLRFLRFSDCLTIFDIVWIFVVFYGFLDFLRFFEIKKNLRIWLNWRALVKSCSPNIEKHRGFVLLSKINLTNFELFFFFGNFLIFWPFVTYFKNVGVFYGFLDFFFGFFSFSFFFLFLFCFVLIVLVGNFFYCFLWIGFKATKVSNKSYQGYY